MKKRWFVLMILSIIIVASLVSALDASDLSNAGNQIIEWIRGIFSPFFLVLLGLDTIDKYFFARILLLILLFVIILTVLKRITLFKKYPAIYVIIAVIVSILSTRYISEVALVSLILLPYGALGITLTVFLPFIIYGFFIHESGLGSAGRRAGWILFAAVFGSLWWVRRTEMGAYNWIYWIGIAGVLVALFLDGTIHKYFELGKYKRGENVSDVNSLVGIQTQINNLKREFGNDPRDFPVSVYKAYSDLENNKKALRKRLAISN